MEVELASEDVLRNSSHNLEGEAVSIISVFPSLAGNSQGSTNIRQINEWAFIGNTLSWLASEFWAHICGMDA